MEQSKALAALEPFLALAPSATSARTAADLVTRATSSPATYSFSRLLLTPQVQALAGAGPEFAPYLRLLEIFSWGTYADYASATPGSLPTLNAQQQLKLRQLSLLALARDPASLRYPALQAALGLTEPSSAGAAAGEGTGGGGSAARALEAVVVSAVYAGLLEATLDPYRQQVQVGALAAVRDPAPGSVPNMVTALRRWQARCEGAVTDLDGQIAAIRADASRRNKVDEAWDERFVGLIESELGASDMTGSGFIGGGKKPMSSLVSNASFSSQLRGAQRYGKRGMMDDADDLDDEAMDVDDEEEEEPKKRASRRKL